MGDEDGNGTSAVEQIKRSSHGLRGPLAGEVDDGADHFTDDAKQLLKFHGSYQQDDRDLRRERKRAGQGPAYSLMVRSRVPGGVLSAEQYLAHDDIAGRYGNGTLRITTRQTFQLHGVLKHDLRSTIRALNDKLVTTLATCGDVNRNVLSCPAPLGDGLRTQALDLARRISEHLLPRTGAYHEIWLDGELVGGGQPAAEEPIYGQAYLPRKFKTAMALPSDNCTDIYANDLGFLLVPTSDGGAIAGFNVLVGGGLGRTHGKEDTYPRLADPLGFIPAAEALEVATAVLTVQRDFGNRVDRRRARLKYLIDERGLDWFRGEVERRLGRRLAEPHAIRIDAAHDHLGWNAQSERGWFHGVFVENGRIRDDDRAELRSALRRIVETFRPGVHLTPQQNLLLTDIHDRDRPAVERILAEHAVAPLTAISTVRRWSMACPALPTCPLALAESERALPSIVARLETELERLGLEHVPLTVRMTGCPNGCARPYTADIAFVGRSLDKYVVYAGGNLEGTRLAEPLADLVPRDRLVETVLPLLERFRDDRLAGERFGDFCHRVGLEELRRAREVA